jgi:hypothetical protein
MPVGRRWPLPPEYEHFEQAAATTDRLAEFDRERAAAVERGDDLPAMPIGNSAQLPLLIPDRLMIRRNTDIEKQPAEFVSRSQHLFSFQPLYQ